MARSVFNRAIYSACLSRLFPPLQYICPLLHLSVLGFSPPLACRTASGGSIGFKAVAAAALMNQACVFVKQTRL